MERGLRKAARSAQGRIALANAADGMTLSLHDPNKVRTVGEAIALRFEKLAPPDKTEAGLCTAIDEACRGEWGPHYRRKPSPFLGGNAATLDPATSSYSTVVNGSVLTKIFRRSDIHRLFGGLLVARPASGGIAAGHRAAHSLLDRSPAARAKRRLRLDASAHLGNGVLWMTRTELIEQLVDEAERSGGNRAELVTDRLGMIDPTLKAAGSALNQRFALHIPASVVHRAAAFRPTFIEAGGYRRFKVKPRRASPPPGWGTTLDLAVLADTGRVADGLPEITLLPLAPRDFRRGELIEVEYLGAIGRSRGISRTDDDARVARLLMRFRTTARAMGALR